MHNEKITKLCKEIAKSKRPDKSAERIVQTLPGDNRRYIEHSMKLAELTKPDLSDVNEIVERVTLYFTICAEDDMRPSVAGLALALDIDRTYIWGICAGKTAKDQRIVNALKKAMKILDLQMVDYMQNGKINPISGIFLMKNCFGYTDKQEVVVTPNQPLGEQKDPDEIKAKYIDSVVGDSNI